MRVTQYFFLLILSIVIFSSYSVAQDIAPKWGEVPKEHLEMNVAPIDSSANAVVLSEFGSYDFLRQMYAINLRYTKRVKLLNERGIDDFSIVKIPYYKKDKGQNILKIKAQIIKNIDGQTETLSVPNSNIITEDTPHGWGVVKIAFPKLAVGDIIEWKYTFISKIFWDIEPWAFQSEYPTLRSEVVIKSISEGFNFKFFANGSDTNKSYDREKNRFLLFNQPPIGNEPFVSNSDDYKNIVYFQLAGYTTTSSGYKSFVSTWAELATDFYDDFEVKSYFKDRKYQNILEGISKGTSDLEYVKNIRSYLTSHYKWNDRWGVFPRRVYNDVVKSKTGSIAELNLQLCGILEAAGFNVTPILISSKSNGILFLESPLLSQFDCLLCMLELDGKEYVLDATRPYLPYNVLTKEAWVEKGLYLKKKEAKIIDLDIKGTDYISRNSIDIKVLEDSMMIVDRIQNCLDYNAVKKRIEIRDKGLEAYLEALLVDEMELDSCSVKNLEEQDEMLGIYSSSSKSIETGNVYIQTGSFFSIKENPFTQETRFLPIEIPNNKTIRTNIKITIPEGYHFVSKPEAVNIVLPEKIGKFILMSHDISDTELQIMIDYSLKKALVLPQFYPYLREFYTRFLAKLNESVVISPKVEN